MTKTERIILNTEEMDSLLVRVSAKNLEDSDVKILTGIIQVYQQIQFDLQEANLSINRLRKTFGLSTEKRKNLSPANDLGEKSSDQFGLSLSETLDALESK